MTRSMGLRLIGLLIVGASLVLPTIALADDEHGGDRGREVELRHHENDDNEDNEVVVVAPANQVEDEDVEVEFDED